MNNSHSVHPTQAAVTAAFFLPLSVLPWLNPVAGGAITAAIPLLIGWLCIALLFIAFPRPHGHPPYAIMVLACAALLGLVTGSSWQLLAVGLLMIAAATTIGTRLAQEPLLKAHTSTYAFNTPSLGIELIAWSWLISGYLNACIGLLQYFGLTAWLGDIVNHASPGQVYGNLRQRNHFATLMNMALWSLWYLWQSKALQRNKDTLNSRPFLLAAITLPLTICLALTLSRTGMMQLLALLLMLGGWMLRSTVDKKLRQGTFAWLAGVLLVYLATAYVVPLFYGKTDIALRLAGQDSRACISRVVLWGNVLDLIAQKPLTGWGWGELDFAHYSANYTGTRFCDMLDNAHNLPLHLAVELGVPASLLAYAVVLWWVLRNRPWAERQSERQLAWGVLVAIAIHSLLEYPLWYATFELACGLALGILMGTTQKTNPPIQRSTLLAQRTIGVLLLAGVVYAGFDFLRVTQLYMAEKDRVWPFKINTRQQAERSVLYKNAVKFAKLTTEPVTPGNASRKLLEAQELMHYSPEARVVERIIECLQILGKHTQAQQMRKHYQEVYPQEYAEWLSDGAGAPAHQ